MNTCDFDRERRRERRLEKLGTDNPHCAVCGNGDDRVLELHHIAGRKHDDLLVIVCGNCHQVLSDDQRDHPAAMQGADPFLVTVAYFLRGLADMLLLIVERLVDFSAELLIRAAPSGEVVQ